MRPPEALYRFLRNWEGRGGKPVLEAYLDGGGVPTIGYGHTHGVKLGDTCTAEQAEDWLRAEVDEAWFALDPYIKQMLVDNEMSAVTSVAFNVGLGKPGVKDGILWLKNGKHSTLLTKLNDGDFGGAAEEFGKWNKVRDPKTGRLVPDKGVTRRRAAEALMFLEGKYIGP